MTEDAEIKGVIPNYYNFIIDKLNRISEAWDNEYNVLALQRSLKLVRFLPRKLKKQLNDDVKRIQNQFENLSNVKGYNYRNTKERALWATNKIALKELEPFIDKLTDLLDQEHLLTQSYGIPTKNTTMREFQLTVDKAKYGRQE